jgi:hypothetical protein
MSEPKEPQDKPDKPTTAVITKKEQRHTLHFDVDVPFDSFIACRKYLFENGLSLQEFFSRVMIMLENKDPAMKAAVEMAKKNKVANAPIKYVFSNPKSLYAALEHRNPLKSKEE